ncbi:hypothetical protein K435DRAFT_836775 [Dendrothele bispora CBS 962.96]|uniref:DUF6533 domain-containing protein n=1 Tax=Dendrothele bispora (strain CBS 962.96) TaxID=1314807 RepID=A0A4V4HH77_DENBC|nr:hypothetical protein K435DRAFT_836775 [Dendrothele bispora CBS 962.96]
MAILLKFVIGIEKCARDVDIQRITFMRVVSVRTFPTMTDVVLFGSSPLGPRPSNQTEYWLELQRFQPDHLLAQYAWVSKRSLTLNLSTTPILLTNERSITMVGRSGLDSPSKYLLFLLYDQLLMLGMEIQYIWMKRKRRSAYWFFLLRYFVSTGEIVILVSRFWGAGCESRCLSFQMYTDAQTLVVKLSHVHAGLRHLRTRQTDNVVYDCCSRNFVSLCCNLIFTWGCAFIYDLTIFLLAAWKTYRSRQSYTGPVSVRIPLLDLMLRDGVIYFGVRRIMSAVHLANVILCATRVGFFLVSRFQDFVHYNSTITVINISAGMALRLMLNLHTSASEGLLAASRLTNQNHTSISGSRNVSSGLAFRPPPPDTVFTTPSLNE